MTLREQIYQITVRYINGIYARETNIPSQLNTLAKVFFMLGDIQCLEARAVRKALYLLDTTGVIAVDEPALTDPRQAL